MNNYIGTNKNNNMKKIALMLLAVCLTMGVCAKEKKDDSKYLVGAVKTENGLITFSKTFTIKGMTEEQLATYNRTLEEMHRPVTQYVPVTQFCPWNYGSQAWRLGG